MAYSKNEKLIRKHITRYDYSIIKRDSPTSVANYDDMTIYLGNGPHGRIAALLHEYYHLRHHSHDPKYKINRMTREYKAEQFTIRVMRRLHINRTAANNFLATNWNSDFNMFKYGYYNRAYRLLKINGYL